LAQEDSVVQSHLIRYGFVKDYTVWKFHSEGHTTVTGASEQNSSRTTTSVNEIGQQPSSPSAAIAGSGSANRDYVNIDELLQDMAANDGDVWTKTMFCLGMRSGSRIFKEMKQAAIDPLYKDRPKKWMTLHFNLQLLMLKFRHGWFDTSFNDLLRMLADCWLSFFMNFISTIPSDFILSGP